MQAESVVRPSPSRFTLALALTTALVLGPSAAPARVAADGPDAGSLPGDGDAPAPETGGASRVLRFRFHPTERAQLALWVESADGSVFRTVELTQATARRGIGNRPGALQMNSGFRWPYGRREGTLPVWAHRRVEVGGQAPFRRVIFRDRVSEGAASQAPTGMFARERYQDNPDDYFCLSFRRELSAKDALDAVACATVFSSDRGRYLTEADVARGYAEPFVQGTGAGAPMMRPLSLTSYYPPRRDVVCDRSDGCLNHPDVQRYASDARAAMPEIDEVTIATLPSAMHEYTFVVPDTWPDGDYVAYLEINVEGDYNEVFNDVTYPTPVAPSGQWDYWAMSYGYPYRGQPSVVFRVPFVLGDDDAVVTTSAPAGYGALHGEDGLLRDMGDGVVTDDPVNARGSGADRLIRQPEGWRFAVEVQGASACADARAPGPLTDFFVGPSSDDKHSHEHGVLRFRVPTQDRAIARYEVRVSREPITDLATFLAGQPANEASLEDRALVIPTGGAPGTLVEVTFGGLVPQSRFYVGVRAIDACGKSSPIATGELETTAINFTVVSPCFVATAAYGSPLAAEIGALRRFRDRHLRTNAPGRALVDAYRLIGPTLAEAIAAHDTLRAVARAALTPVVRAAAWLDEDGS
jgi:hypothetical protein